MNFKTWKEHKKVQNHDLIFTEALKESQHLLLFEKVADQMATLNPSFTEGLAFLELCTDLILMGHLEELFESSNQFATWSHKVKQLRYPQTSNRDETTKSILEKMPWPSGSKLKFERRGDKFGVELKVFISNPTDLNKVISALERVQSEMKP
jgi:hypothetical protein